MGLALIANGVASIRCTADSLGGIAMKVRSVNDLVCWCCGMIEALNLAGVRKGIVDILVPMNNVFRLSEVRRISTHIF